ncbi:glycoside hydrolase family 73 protein [Paenibacillus sp. N3/727]|uniref:glycoside hydrolase family 73 protein n=1 Tax=Paenibacillus sp. N3/727 TaxID=2925845 RepID=UPI001F5306C4|nr:glycoside hydrolase family 73 protein [Paenibacillus sp. N3/727]UNK17635.1 glycoside hydrolase family 73 protein [Paenibacillus sp. N3/727]
MKPHEFIAKLAPIAVEDMRRYGVPASLTIAQAILESNWGKSGLTQKANNLFGIKGTGPAGSVTMPTVEYKGQTRYTTNAQFRKYNSWSESVEDHTRLILNGTRDKPKRYHGVLWAEYKTAATAIWKGGYATDPSYPQKLISIIEKYDLNQYDLQGQVKEEDIVKIEALTAEVQKLKEQVRLLTDNQAAQTKIVEKQESQINQLQNTVKSLQNLHTSESVPSWAEPALQAAIKAGVIQGKEGSYDFYRAMTVLYRLGLLDGTK